MPNQGSILKSATANYVVTDTLGGGGAGEVCSVTDDSNNVYAAKVLRTGVSTQKLKRFQNELMFGLREDHPHIVKVLDFGKSEKMNRFT